MKEEKAKEKKKAKIINTEANGSCFVTLNL
jgi:hypothetical protein